VRLSLRWLADYVRVGVSPEKLAEMLDLSGTKVEAIHRPAGEIDGVIVAEVAGIVPHPNADNLVLVDVRPETGDVQRVVCGARNFEVGDKVPLAMVGAKLPGMEIAERKIRGEVSRGMLCSAAELGVSKDHSGILVLPREASPGADVVEELGLDDTILDLEITPNRPDRMSMVGMAREIAALLGEELVMPAVDLAADAGIASPVEVEVEDPEGCPRYLARYIESLRVGPSPSWMARRLTAGGIRPISNVVDATNYVLLELGHPLHAFDAVQVAGQKIVVRRARRQERFTTLDGVDRLLDEEDLLIADGDKALGIAGVMGGEASEVSDATTAVILESAYFDPRSIALTARRHLLRTEASARFERGADPEMVPIAAARAAPVLRDQAGGALAPRVTAVYPQKITRPSKPHRTARTEHMLGMELSAERQASYLSALGLRVDERQGVLDIKVPSFRVDLEREIDLIEEVARLAGFELLPSTVPPGRSGRLELHQEAERTLRRILAGFGLHEAWTSSFGSPQELDALGLAEDHPARRMVVLSNPTSEEQPAMRSTLLPGLLRAAARNVAQGIDFPALFEIARIYERAEGTLPREPLVLGAVMVGDRRPRGWGSDASRWDFFGAKGIVESLLGSIRIPGVIFEPATGPPFHPTRAARMALEGNELGALGELHPDVCERFDLPEGAIAFELGLAGILAALPGRPRIEELPRFPPVLIDVAVVVDEQVPAEKVRGVIEEAGAPELESMSLFDIYRGEQIPPGKKSLAYALRLRSKERTLTDDDAVAVRDRIVSALAQRVAATLRG
jgi:phenylalanyl-tRNA synthetase beta chain